ncbi:hypothetical protein EOE18_15355 [Novosphingobium umbonatum]|uniref:Uncharacterized protein n=1 Tax=Novosphingobium umbonatum TaxID=1908524 RepID=A0A3S2UQD6_9SPHN|nr:hypothetical protein [Novosphingobium umbonatum]RVU03498.1 hypothetical protein EOE18_15355 [Novosphingobium umbonatum]
MDLTVPRSPRQTSAVASPGYSVDPETGQPMVYGTAATVTPGTANGAILMNVDLTCVGFVVFNPTGTYVATMAYEQTLDGTNWFAVAGLPMAGGVPAATDTASTAQARAFPAVGKAMRVRLTAYTSGTVNGQALLVNGDVPIPYAPSLTGSQSSTTLIGSVSFSTRASGGCSTGRIVTGTSGVIKNSSGQLYGYDLMNVAAATRYLQFYAKSSAGVPGTDTPFRTLPIPAGQLADSQFIMGVAFTSGISWAITTDAVGTTLAASTDIVGSVEYA